MTEDVRALVFEEALSIADERSDSLSVQRENAPSYLRNAMMKLIEGWASEADNLFDRGEYQVAYGSDEAQFREFGSRVDWWENQSPRPDSSRIRVEAVEADKIEPPATRLLSAIGATFVLHETDPVHDYMPAARSRDNEVYHFIQDHQNSSVEAFRKRL